MNDPSSRTPEGIPHRCDVCGTEFRLNLALSGDTCCPNCNSLAWPVGDDASESQSQLSKATTLRTKEVRIRPKTDAADISDETRRILAFLKRRNDVSVSVLFPGRDPEHQALCRSVLERLVDSLVPELAVVKTPPHLATRRICCTLSPPNPIAGG
ncbi:hypothetical protein [Allorhodopirellula heiligendammensis]|uniref:hypothetical protein n=1 Tax=Allorhodopirellula heiligendammensis TaxID=2714739 RepID=UPI0011B76F03